MKVKKLFLGLFGVAAVTTLVACGGQTNPSSGGGQTTPTSGGGQTTPSSGGGQTTPSSGGGQTTPSSGGGQTVKGSYDITVWVGESVVDLTKKQIADYNALDSTEYTFNATVNPVSESQAGGTVIEDVEKAADIYCFAQDQLARLVEASAISRLGKAASAFVEENNDAGSVAASKVGDATYAYPLSSDNGYFMFYDKRFINEEHLDDLDALLADCQANNKNFSFEAETNAWYTAAFFFATGCVSEWSTKEDGTFNEAVDTFNSPKGVIALKGLRSLVTHRRFINAGTNDFSADASAVASAVVVTGTWNSATIESTLGENMGVTDLPSFKVNNVSYHLGSFAGYKLMAVKPQTDATKQAQLHKLAQYLSGEAAQTERFDEVQWGPSNLAAQEDDDVKANKPLAALAKQSSYAIPQGQFPNRWWDITGTLGGSVKALAADAPDSAYEAILNDYFDAISALANTDGKLHTDVVWADHTWGVVGSFAGSSWGDDGDDVALVPSEDGKTYTSAVITFAEGDLFKVRADGQWQIDFGQGNEMGGDNFVIEEAGDYKIQMTIDEDNNPTIIAISSNMTFGLVGSFAASGWGSSPDIELVASETEDDTYEITYEFAAGDQFKIRGNNDWDSGFNIGDDGQGGAVNAGSSGNWTIAEAGTYLIKLVFGSDGSITVTCEKVLL